MATNSNPSSKLEFSNYGETCTYTWDHSDITISEVLDAFIGILVTSGYSYPGILDTMKREAEDRLNTCINNAD